MLRACIITVFLAGLFFTSPAQRFGCLNYAEASQDPSQAHCLYLDCQSDECAEFASRLADFSALTTLELINLNRDFFPKELSGLKQLNTLILTQCPSVNLNNLLRKFVDLPLLTELVLDNNGMDELPRSIGLMQNLKRLVIKNNEHLNVERSILQLNHLASLRELALPVNQISDLPDNIALLRQLEVLDLSDNQLADLPGKMRELDSLEVLNIEKNVFVNQAQSLQKLSGLSIRYLSLDAGLSPQDRDRLKRLFPRAEIVELLDTTSVEEDIKESLIEEQSISVVEDSGDQAYQTIMVGGENFQALSDAYLHYARIFDSPLFKSDFDSLLFDERYLDTAYSNVWKTQPWKRYDNIRLYYYKGGEKGQIWFDFQPDKKNGDAQMADPYITKNNPELLCFLGLKWVYQGPLSKSQFIRQYIKTERGIRYWMDVRIYYNEAAKLFTIELKDKNGFASLTAGLRNRTRSVSGEKTQEAYSSYYEKYIKALDGRRKRFHKRLVKDKSAYDLTLERTVAGAWDNFSLTYLSPEEQRMSRKAWLDYYDKVLADEQEALNNAAPVFSLVKRSLILNNYTDASLQPLPADTTRMKGVHGLFRDEQNNRIAVTRIMLLNLTDKTFRVFEGSLGLKTIRLYLDPLASYAMIAEIRNGDVGILTASMYADLSLRQNMECLFTLKRLSSKISSIRQIRDLVGF